VDIDHLDQLTQSVSMLLSRRVLAGVLGLRVMALPGLAASKRKRAKTKTVTKMFANEGTIAIPAVGSPGAFGPANPYPATIDVTGFTSPARISDVNLTLHGLSHSVSHDLIFLLVAPGGRNAVVLGQVGINGPESAVDDVTLTLDDEAEVALPGEEEPLISGTFRHRNTNTDNLPDFPAPAPTPSDAVALSTFDDINPNGRWQLFIFDHGGNDVGSLVDGWSLEITAKHKRKRKKRH
jgi:hypothetical protein